MQAFYLAPKSVFPRQIPSHMLFSAICTAMEELGGPVDEMLKAFSDKPPFLITSAFPFAFRNGQYEHFLPKPFIHINLHAEEEGEFERIIKFQKAKYLHSSIFARLVEGSESAKDIVGKLGNELNIQSSCIYKGKDLPLKIEHTKRPHNTINRVTMTSGAFYSLEGYSFKGGGLYFLIRYNDESWRGEIAAALSLLEDRGFGPRISIGMGRFELSTRDVELIPGFEADLFVTLSRFCPDHLRMLGDRTAYELLTLRGRSSDGQVKRMVRMVSEGSVFANTGNSFYGKIVKVRENPPAVEYGIAFPVPFRWSV